MPPPPRVMPALVTPFDEDGEVDLDAHHHNVGHLTEWGIEGFVLGGSNGEGPYLEPGERRRLVVAARAAAPAAHLMAGVMAETVREAVRQLDECGEADSVLVMTPTTLARNRTPHVLGFFRHVVAASPLPVYLYSVPPNTAYSLPVEAVGELAGHDSVVGMKDSAGDVTRLQRLLAATPDDFLLFSGSSEAVTAAIGAGCHGVITGSLNYVPRLVMDTVEAAATGPTQARSLQQNLSRLSMGVERHGVPGVKAAAALAGLHPGLPRLPLTPVDEDVAAELAALLDALSQRSK